MIGNYGCPNFQSRENLIVVSGQTAGYFFPELEALERLGIMAFKWASSAIYRRDGFLLFLDLAAEQRIGSPLLLSFDCVRGDALGCRAVWNLRASRSIRTSNSTRTESRIPGNLARSTCWVPSLSPGLSVCSLRT